MGSSKFKEYKGLDLPAVNSEVLERWDAVDAFGKSISTREGHPTFVFYEGPPSANGMPGIHHVMARTIKDVVCRYKTQRGFLVASQGRMGYARTARRAGRREEARHHEGGYRDENIDRGVQPHLPQAK